MQHNHNHNHHHNHNSHNKDDANSRFAKLRPDNRKNQITLVIVSAIIFLIAIIISASGASFVAYLIPCVLAYLFLGLPVIIEAAEKVIDGDFFNEEVLMVIATIAAFAIAQPLEAVGVMLFFKVGELFEEIAIERSEKRISEAVDLRSETVLKVLGGAGGEVKIPAKEAKVGDILLVRAGDQIPLDGEVIDGESTLDTSPITGESVPKAVKPGDELISGCINQSGTLTMRVTKPLSKSMVTTILRSVRTAQKRKPKVEKIITKFSRIYTPAVILLAVIVAIIPSLITGEWHQWLYTAVSFLVMSCPCALIISVPLAYFVGIGLAGKDGILFKGGNSMEALSTIKAVAFDKTGTVTRGEFKVQFVEIESEAVGFSENDVLQVAASIERRSSHPIAKSIVAEARERGLELFTPGSVGEVAGQGMIADVNGHTILVGNSKLLESQGVEFGIGAVTTILFAVDRIFVAQIGVQDVLKGDAARTVRLLQKAGLQTILLTGDTYDNANLVSEEIGIDKTFAKLLPTEKLEKLEQARSHIGPVMFVGDGINDAPVIAGADIGVAMGSGSDAAIETADVVLMRDELSLVPGMFKIAKSTRLVAYENIAFSLLVKLIVIILGLCGSASMWAAVFADTGVTVLCILNSLRVLIRKQDRKSSRPKLGYRN